MNKIVRLLPSMIPSMFTAKLKVHHLRLNLEKRQTVLFSATQTKKTEDLAKLALQNEPVYIGIDDSKPMATVEGLQQVGVDMN